MSGKQFRLGVLLACAGLVACIARGEFVWDKNLVVEKADAPVTLDSTYKNKISTNMTLHGNLTILMTGSGDNYYINALSDTDDTVRVAKTFAESRVPDFPKVSSSGGAA